VQAVAADDRRLGGQLSAAGQAARFIHEGHLRTRLAGLAARRGCRRRRRDPPSGAPPRPV